MTTRKKPSPPRKKQLASKNSGKSVDKTHTKASAALPGRIGSASPKTKAAPQKATPKTAKKAITKTTPVGKTSFDKAAFARKKAILDSLLNDTDEILSIVDHKYRLLDFNRNFARTLKVMYGTKPRKGERLFDFYNVLADKKMAKAILDRVLAGEKVELDSFRGRAGEERRKFQAVYTPIRDPSGTVVGVLTRARDVTALWKAERDLVHMQEMLETVTLGTKVIICAIDMDYRFTYFNSAYRQEMVRLTGKKIKIGESMLDTLSGSREQKRIAREEWDVVLGGQSSNHLVRFPDARGDQIVYSVLHSPIWDDRGRQVGAGEVAFDTTPQIKIQEALKESEEKYRLLYEHNMDGIFLTAPTGEIFAANQAACDMFQRSEKEICRIGRAGVVDSNDPRVFAAIEERRKTGKFHTEMTCIKADGTHFETEVSSFVFTDSQGNERTSMIVHDITESKKREDELTRLNRTLRALSNSNQAILQAKDPSEYMQQVCRIIRDDCQYTMVWIGLADNDRYKRVRPVAYAGFEEGYLDTLKITWADAPRGRGPTGTAIRTGKTTFCRNMLTDPKFKPWRAEAFKRGYASSIALPMIAAEKAIGAVTIYSREPDPFTPQEVELLEELVSDFSYGISSLRIREQKEKTEQDLRVSEEKFRTMFDTMSQGVMYEDMEGKIFASNAAAEKILGLTHDQAIGRTSMDPRWHTIRPDGTPFPGEEHPIVLAARLSKPVRNVVQGVFNPRINSYRWIEIDAIPQFRQGDKKPYEVYAIFTDITERRQYEIILKESEQKFHSLFESMEELSALHEIVRDADGKAIDYRILDCNPAFTKVTGISHEKAIGALASELYGTNQAPYLDVYSSVVNTGIPTHFETFFSPLKKYFSISVTTPSPGRFSTVSTDITQRKQIEEYTSWQASFPAKNPQPIVEVDPSGRIYYQNPAAQALLPNLAEKGRDHPWLTHLDEFNKEIRKEGSTNVSKELSLGDSHFLQNFTYLVEDKRIRIYATDITATKRAEALQAWLASFPDNYPWPIAEVDSQGKVFYQNPACQMLFPDLEKKGKSHFWLRYLEDYFKDAHRGAGEIASRQIPVGGSHFMQIPYFLPQADRIRIYGTDISKRVQAEEVQAWLASFPDNYPWPIVEVDSAGKVFYQNPACRILFPDLEEKGRDHPWLGYLGEYFAEVDRGVTAIASKEIKVGGTYYLQINNYIGENKRVRIYGTDISSRKRAEAAQAWLASFPDHYPWPIVEVDAQGRVFYQNPACRVMFPDLVEKGKAHPWLQHLGKYYMEAAEGRSSISSQQVEMEGSHYLQTNTYIPESGRVRIYATDISKRVLAEEHRDRLAAILEATPDMVATFTLEGKVLYMNKAGRDTIGIDPDVDISTVYINQQMPGWAAQMMVKDAIPNVLRTGAWAGETAILDKQGKEIPISQSILAHHEPKGEIAYLSMVVRDISQRKQIEDALIQSGAELEQKVRERTRELNESHEKLRQEIEERQRLADSLHDAVNQSLFSAGLIAEVLPRLWERDRDEARRSLQDLRRLTRGAQGEMRALLNELRPSMIADNNLDYLLGLLAETFSGRTNIPVSVSTPRNVKLPQEVKTVYYRVCQEALNNVAKHANASQVQIHLTQHNGVTDLRISDNGCGFDPKDASISHYGLGMIRERMNSIHGQLAVDSRKGKGCMIHILWSEKDAREEE